MKTIVPTKKSRPVRFTDLFRVLTDGARIKWAMLSPFPGRYPFAASVSHCQICENDPLRFFVLDREGGTVIKDKGVVNRLVKARPLKTYFGFPWARTIINPRIVETHGKLLKSDEACMSFPDEKPRRLKRHEIVDVEYWTFFGKRKKRFWLERARIIQHETDHMDNILIDDRWKHKV